MTHGLEKRNGEHIFSEKSAQLRPLTEVWYSFDLEKGTIQFHMRGIVHTIGVA